jgi:ribosomal protein L14
LIKKETQLIPIDKTGVLLANVFHLYKGGMRKTSRTGDFVKISVRIVKPDMVMQKKQKSVALCINTVFRLSKLDSSSIFFYQNDCLLIKRKFIFRSKEILYPGNVLIRRKKLIYKFPGVL